MANLVQHLRHHRQNLRQGELCALDAWLYHLDLKISLPRIGPLGASIPMEFPRELHAHVEHVEHWIRELEELLVAKSVSEESQKMDRQVCHEAWSVPFE